jgi:hypothetical protein
VLARADANDGELGYMRAWDLDHGDMSSWASVLCEVSYVGIVQFNVLLVLLTEVTLINFFN